MLQYTCINNVGYIMVVLFKWMLVCYFFCLKCLESINFFLQNFYLLLYSNIVLYGRASGGDSCGVSSDNSSDRDPYDLSTNQRIGIYGGIVFVSIVIVGTKTILNYLICIAASRNLHNKMFKSILRAPVLFYDTNPVGMCV